MTSSRLQHTIPGGAILLLAIVVAWLSFTQQPAESFLFPRIISIAFVFLAVWNFARAILGLAKVGGGIAPSVAMNVLPGLIVMLIYVFWAAKALGFYTASVIAFFAVYSLYDPVPISSGKDWVKRAGATAAFMAVIYTLFYLVLQVQTPRGMFF
jgi:hypothetical protein